MEIKDRIEKPYTEKERIDFIVVNNHQKGYEIKETESALEAWGRNDIELLEQIKKIKSKEASNKAYEYINNGEALYEVEEGTHIEATDGNISKLGLAAVELVINQDTESTIEWCSYEDKILYLNATQLQKIVKGLKDEQSRVWVELYPEFLKQIEQAKTLEEVNLIVIDYKKLN